MPLNRKGAISMSPWSTRLAIAGILTVVLLEGGCTTGAPSGAPPVGPTRIAAATPTIPAPSATAIPSISSPPQPSPTSASTSAEPPPAAAAVDGGDPVVGQLGSFTWGAGGSDSPWLPGAPITVGTGERLTVSIADGVSVTAWTAKRVPSGTANGTGAVALGTGTTPITFAAPGPGTWSVQVTVQFADTLGSAAYYWSVTVR
jgi:hypothetical protein